MEEKTSLMNKKTTDLTVADALKINLGIVAIMVAVPVGISVAVAAKEKVSDWRMSRKAKKTIEITEQ